jgi:hypothetical protein
MTVVASPREDPHSDALPSPVTFEIDAAESKRLRAELFASFGGKMSLPIYAVQFAMFAAQSAMRFSSHGFGDVEGRVLVGILVFYAVVFSVIILRGTPFAAGATVRPGGGATIDFQEAGLGIVRRTRTRETPRRFFPLAKIRSVRFLTDSILLSGPFGPLVVIPKSACADGGSAIARYFEARLIGKRMLRRSIPLSHSIVNTRYS